MRGAARTLLDREGDSADQALLLTTLLRIAGHTAIIVYSYPDYQTGYGGAIAPITDDPLGYDVASWLGCEADGETVWRALNAAGLDRIVWSDGYVSFEHYWVALEADDGWIFLDPSFKPQDLTPSHDACADMSYDRATFLDGLFVSASDDSVAGLSTNEVASRMAAFSGRLKSAWDAASPDADALTVMGGTTLRPQDPMSDSWFFHLLYDDGYFYDLLSGSDAYVNSHRASLTILLESASATVWTDETASHTIWMSFTNAYDSAWPASEVFVDNRRILVEPNEWTLPDAYVRVGMRVPPSHYRTADYSFVRSADSVRVLVQGFGASRPNPWRERVADALTDAMRNATQNPVAAHVAELSYLGETHRFMSALAQRNIARIGGISTVTPTYDMGLVGDSPAPWLDFKNVFTASGSGQAHLGVDSVFESALEHAAIEMFTDPDKTAVSTVRLLTRAASTGVPVFLATSNNWSAVVRPTLVGYPADELESISSYVGAGYNVLLPRDGQLADRDWDGSAYVVFGTDAQNVFVSGMLIKGTLGGGYATESGSLDSALVKFLQRYKIKSPATPPRDLGADPVDMRTGAFLSRRKAIETIGPDPVSFTLDYDSRFRAHDVGFGCGWTCGEVVSAHRATDALSALGCRGRDDAIATVAAATVVGDLLSVDSPQSLMAAMAVADWWSRQLLRGSVLVSSGDSALSFTRLPDGSFASPPGVQATLSEEDGAYILTRRPGRTLGFDADGRLVSDHDRAGRGIGFTYSDEGQLLSITNSFGASITLSYENGHAVAATDHTGRMAAIHYDADGRLAAVVDPAGGVWSNAYDEATGAISSQVNPDGVMTVENRYNEFGQVTNQTSASGGVWTFGNAGGRIAWDEDPLGNRRERIYSDEGRVLRLVERGGATNDFAYTANGLLASHLYPGGRLETFEYDGSGNMIRSTESDSNFELARSASFVYDAHNRLVAVTNALGEVSTTAYDDRDRPVRMVRSDGSAHEFSWSSAGLLAEEREIAADSALLLRTTFAYDSHGHLLSRTVTGIGLPQGGIVEAYTYDEAGRLASVTDAEGRTSSFAYDAAGRLVESTDPAGKKTHRAYTPSGRLASVTDSFGRTTAFSWTPSGELASVAYPDGNVETNAYDAADRLATATDVRGSRTEYTRDAIGRILAQATPSGTDVFAYDVSGNLVAAMNAAGERVTFSYDGLNRPVAAHDALGNMRGTGYDLLDRPVSTTDPQGKICTTAYDVLGRQIVSTRPSGVAERFGYDVLGNLVTITNAEGHVYQMTYDALGRRLSATDATGHLVETNIYDKVGNLVSRADGNGDAVNFIYDNCDRLLSRFFADGAEGFAYDAVGNLVSASNGVARETFSYDVMDRLVAATTAVAGVSFPTEWRRDAGGLVTNVVYAPGRAVMRTYDSGGRLVAVSDWLGHEWTFAYDGAGKPTGGTSPDGTAHGFAYDAAGRLVGWNVGEIMGRTIERDAAGRRVCDTVTAGPMPASSVDRRAVNTFDAADRLVVASVTYAVTNVPVAEAYLYDGNGALTNATCGGETLFAAAYDGQGRLASLGGLPSTATVFSYDAIGNRVLVGDRIFVPDHADPLKRPLIECAADGTPLRFFIWGNGRLLGFIDSSSGRDGVPSPSVGGSPLPTETLTVVHSDEQGNVVALTDISGNILHTANYGPHGEGWGAVGENPTPFAWLGGFGVMRTAANSNSQPQTLNTPFATLYLTRHRLYSPTLNRFLSSDPLGQAGGLNLYAYGNCNPLAYIDPLGLCAEGPWYDRLSAWTLDKVNVAKDFYGEHLPWWAAGTVATGMDLVTGPAHFPSAVGHLGEGAGTFAGNPSWETAPGLCQDVATVASIGALTASALPSLNGTAAAASSAPIAKPNALPQPTSRVTTDFIVDAEVKSFGKVLGKGTIDVRSTINGIKNGSIPERATFMNTEQLLPIKEPGYYKEYVLPTPTTPKVGPQRIIRGRNGEMYYTPDHYRSFIPLN